MRERRHRPCPSPRFVPPSRRPANTGGQTLDLVRGRVADGKGGSKQAAFYAGELPQDPAHILAPARKGDEKWLDGDYEVMQFLPAPLTLRPHEGPPHIRLDRAADFLIGDKL